MSSPALQRTLQVAPRDWTSRLYPGSEPRWLVINLAPHSRLLRLCDKAQYLISDSILQTAGHHTGPEFPQWSCADEAQQLIAEASGVCGLRRDPNYREAVKLVGNDLESWLRSLGLGAPS